VRWLLVSEMVESQEVGTLLAEMAAETMSIEMMAGMVRNATEASPAAPESCHAFFVQPYRSFYMAEEPEWAEETTLGVFSLHDLATSGWCSIGCLFGEGYAVRW